MNIVVLDSMGKVWALPKDMEPGYFGLLKHIVHHNHLPEYYGRKATTLLIGGKIVCTDLNDRAHNYVEELNREVFRITLEVRSKHRTDWAWG